MNHSAASTARADSTSETERMVREEIFFRPARRAAIFCAIVCVSLLGYASYSDAAAPSATAAEQAQSVDAEPVKWAVLGSNQ